MSKHEKAARKNFPKKKKNYKKVRMSLNLISHPTTQLVCGGLFEYLISYTYYSKTSTEVVYKLLQNGQTEKMIVNMVLSFCFPEETDDIESVDEGVFSFTLTDIDGIRSVGYCKRFTASKPYQCVCLVTKQFVSFMLGFLTIICY